MVELINAARVGAVGDDPRLLRDGLKSGSFVRVRRGWYVSGPAWRDLDAVERHVVAIRAAVGDAGGPRLVAGRSAAALHDLPLAAEWPHPVVLLAPWTGGGATEPGVRRTAEGWATAVPDSARGIPATTRARTLVDLARSTSTDEAIALLDWASSRRRSAPMGADEIALELRGAGLRRGVRRLEKRLEICTSLSDSWGESLARIAILRLGFAAPVLQQAFVDELGEMEVDFYWPDADVACEFDGKVKYTRQEYTAGDPSEVVWKEKLREDRLRPQVRTVVRVTFADLLDPERLERLLTAARVPRGPRRVF